MHPVTETRNSYNRPALNRKWSIPKMGVFTLILFILLVIRMLFASRIRPASPGLAFVLELVTLLFAIPAVYCIFKIFSGIRNRLLWKIRRRLILAHIFIGAIPVFLV